MPKIKDIVEEMMEIVFKEVQINPFQKSNIRRLVRSSQTALKFYHREVVHLKDEPSHLRRMNTLKGRQESGISLKTFNEFELKLVEIICKVNKIKVEDFCLTRRQRILVDARFQFMSILRLYYYYTYERIAFLLQKDHSSIIHGVNQHSDFVQSTAIYKRYVVLILKEFITYYPLIDIGIKENTIRTYTTISKNTINNARLK